MVKRNSFNIIGEGEDDGANSGAGMTYEDYEHELDSLIKKYFEHGVSASRAPGKKERKNASNDQRKDETEIKKLVLDASVAFGSDSEEFKKFIDVVQDRIKGLALATELDVNQKQFRRWFASTMGGVSGGVTEAIKQTSKEIKNPIVSLAGHLAELLVGAVVEATKGVWHGLKRFAA